MRCVCAVIAALLISGCITMEPELTINVEFGPFTEPEAEHHQAMMQMVLDLYNEVPATFTFAAGDYYMTDPAGLRVPEGATLNLGDARFIWSENITEDGQTFLVEDASNVSIFGGVILGARDSWDAGVNVAGIRVLGQSHNLLIEGTICENLSSNAFGVFGGSDEDPIRNVSLVDVEAKNCCNYYGDYLGTDSGPAKGSDRKDQGGVAFYHVNGWRVENSRFLDSQSDGTHFYHAHNGEFVNCEVKGSQMGGYFLEGCEDVFARNNVIDSNGSRGVTIERDSKRCILTENVVTHSGREGLWAPDVADITVSRNTFTLNGQKDDGDKDCEIRIDETDKFETVTAGISIESNTLETSAEQTAAIYISDGVGAVIVRGNTFTGGAPELKASDAASVTESP